MSKAAFYRALKGATLVHVTNERYPALSGLREVVRVKSNAVALRLPVEHPRYDEVRDGSWTYWDKADRTEGDTYVHVDPLTGAILSRFRIATLDDVIASDTQGLLDEAVQWEDASTATYTAERAIVVNLTVTVCENDEGPLTTAHYWEVTNGSDRLSSGWSGSYERAKLDAVNCARAL